MQGYHLSVILQSLRSYTGIVVAVSHDEVEGGTGLTPVLIDGAAAVLKDLLAQVSTLLCLLLEQKIPKLYTEKRMTPGKHVNGK